jgi:uncharacterized protein (DUF1778 family)
MTKSSQLMVRLDEDSKSYLTRAAALRKVSLSDYVRMVGKYHTSRMALSERMCVFANQAAISSVTSAMKRSACYRSSRSCFRTARMTAFRSSRCLLVK